MDLANVNAIVTGGASGMGRCFVEQLRAAGARAFFCDVDAEGVASTAHALDAPGCVADVSREEDVERLFSAAWDALGRVDVLINNAGIIRDGLLVKRDRKTGDLVGLSRERWDQVLAVNLTGPFLCMRAFALRCLAHGVRPAVAVNMSSVTRAGNVGQSNYAATKAGLVADTTLWARELAPHGIRVTAIAPGYVATPMLASMRPEVLEKVLDPIPLKRLGRPEEIWQAVRFAIECEYFTGRVLDVDGGLRL